MESGHNINLLVEQANQSFDTHQNSIFEAYAKIISFPTISSSEDSRSFIECSNWLIQLLKKHGCYIECHGDPNRPIIIASTQNNAKQKPLLFYTHYDIQPADPLDLWETHPFTLENHEGNYFARGAQDNKGQLIYTIMAILHAKKSIKQPIKILFDPEEEIGSPSLDSQIHEILNSLECKNLIIVDGLIPAENQAAITVGCRGIVTFDVSLDYHPSDLHSGLFGGLASNPALDLAKALSQAHDKNGSIAIPSFYDSIDKSAIDFQKKFNSPLLQTELSSVVKLNNNISNLWASPTFEVNGIQSGFCGEGFKTIIPSKASAKISCRLVPGQDPKEIGQIVKSFILSKVPYPDLCTIKINKGSGSAFFTDPQTPFIQTLKNTFSTVLDSQCQINCIGGSIPIVAKLQKCLKAPTAIIGLGLSSDLIHAPNEHFSYNRMKQGYAFIYSLLHTL